MKFRLPPVGGFGTPANGCLYLKGISIRDNVWTKSDGYPHSIHETLVRLMSNFDLAFRMINTDDYLVAELLPMEAPDFEWDYENNLMFQYRYNFMPAGVMPRFIVKIHEYIERDKDKKYMCWRLGALLKWKKTRAYVRALPMDKRIEIRITGKKKDELLPIIRNVFGEINERFQKLEIIENIPCKCSDNCTYQFGYEYLKEMKRKGKTTVSCQVTAKDVHISELLEGITPIEDKQGKGSKIWEGIKDFTSDTAAKTIVGLIKD
ncbi:MAG: hypothetical protein HQK99_15335 [Nitrospirae bacterium]|nr:hypothetical protein [Nitrospirota bacterium]